MKNSISLIVIVLFVILVVAGYFWYKTQQSGIAPEPAPPITTLPGIKPVTNPLAANPDLNPMNKANPFRDLYQNPFAK